MKISPFLFAAQRAQKLSPIPAFSIKYKRFQGNNFVYDATVVHRHSNILYIRPKSVMTSFGIDISHEND